MALDGQAPIRGEGQAMGTVARARQLRREMSLPEVLLWQQLRRKSTGLKFRKQHRVPPYFVDFYCAAAKLAIEVDGIAHDMGDRPERDELRTAWLEEQGLRVVRIEAREVLRDPDEIAQAIVTVCRSARNPSTTRYAGGPPPRSLRERRGSE